MIKSKTPARARHIKSILVGFRLLEALETAGPLTLKELSERSGLAPGHAHQYLTSFAMVGLVGQHPETAQYELGSYALTLGLAALRHLDVLERAKEPMQRLRRASGQSVLLSVWANHGPTIVASIPGTQLVPLRLMTGYVLRLGSATGRIFVAHLPRWQTQSVARADDAAVRANPHDLRRILASGVSASGKDRRDGFASLAVPIFNHDGELCAALTVTGSEADFSRSSFELIERLKAVGREISAQMGYRRDVAN